MNRSGRPIRGALLRVEQSLGLIDRGYDKVLTSEDRLARSRAILAAADSDKGRKHFARRMDRSGGPRSREEG